MLHRHLPLLALTLLASTALAVRGAEAAPILIDSFDTGFAITGPGSVSDAGGLGGSRIAQVFSSDDKLDAVTIPGTLVVTDDSNNSAGVEALVSWTLNPAVDLIDGTNDRFALLIADDLVGNWTASITAYTSDNLFATVAHAVSAPSTTLTFLFSEFVDSQVPGVGPVDFSSIDHLQLSLYSASSPDDILGVAELRAVPEPDTATLFLAGVLGLALATPRRRLVV